MGKRLVVIAASLLVMSAAAGCARQAPGGERGPLVVATTTIVGDLVHNVAGNGARVVVLIPIGADPHEFQPSARQGALVREADLVVTSGLGLEEGLQSLIEAARDEGVEVLELGPRLDPLPWEAEGIGDQPGEGPLEHQGLDPHWWLDPVRTATAARLIAARLEALAAGGAWQRRADRYVARLQALDRDVQALVAPVPQQRRKLVTLHRAFGYFAARYGFRVIGVVIAGGSTEALPSAQEIAGLAARIRDQGVPAIFAETTLPTRLADSLARAVGPDIRVVRLYTGSVGEPSTQAGTYLGMIATDAQRIAAALG
ncbi:MAG TPA: metal ABC transporter substrate-binding protein [Actinomycetes bacterium]|jgi:zinc/manganese transport system substrate-binding protein|nr:metal ABC transporter substrate-binding protein [Actinomycetes bacterium]